MTDEIAANDMTKRSPVDSPLTFVCKQLIRIKYAALPFDGQCHISHGPLKRDAAVSIPFVTRCILLIIICTRLA